MSFHIGLSPTFLKLSLLALNSIDCLTSSKDSPFLAGYLMAIRFMTSLTSMRETIFIIGIIRFISAAFSSGGMERDIS